MREELIEQLAFYLREARQLQEGEDPYNELTSLQESIRSTMEIATQEEVREAKRRLGEEYYDNDEG